MIRFGLSNWWTGQQLHETSYMIPGFTVILSICWASPPAHRCPHDLKRYIVPRSDLNHVVIVPQDEVEIWRSVERDLQPVSGRVDDVKVARFRARRWRRGGVWRRGWW